MTALQLDLETPVNVPALGGLTLAQAMEVFNTLRPLGNIGGIIVGSGAANAHPNVTLNPRFTRYIWLDTQTANATVLKLYQGTYPSDTYADWTTSVIANESITAAKLADYAVSILNAAGAKKIAYKQDGTADATKSNFLLRLDAAGQYVEVVNATTVFGAMTVALSQLNVSGATNGAVLQYNSGAGTPNWVTLSVSGLIADNSIALSKLLNFDGGNAGFILQVRTSSPYDVVAVDNNNVTNSGLLPIRSIPINRLAATTAVAKDVLYFDGVNWARYTPFYGAPTSGGTTLPAVTGAILSVAHGLGVRPRRIGGFLVNTVAEFGYNGDSIDIKTLMKKGNGGEVRFGVALGCTDTTVYAVFDGDGGAGAAKGFYIPDKATFVESQLTLASWNVFLWAEI